MKIISSSGSAGLIGTNYDIGRDKGLTSPDIRQWREAVQKGFLRLSKVAKPNLSFVTVLIGAEVIERNVRSTMATNMITDFRRAYRSRCKHKLGGMRTIGVFEVDVLCSWLAGDKQHKEAFLSGLGINVADVGRDQRILLPHFHAVVDRGHHSQARLHGELAAEFPGQWRVLAKRLHDDKSVRQNLTNLAGYCSKLKVAYSDFGPDQSTRFHTLHEDHWRTALVDVIDRVGLDQLMFKHGGS